MKTDNIYTSAVIVAAGKGTRMKTDISKQFIEISGIPVLVRTLYAFEKCTMINEIILVTNETDMVYCRDSIINYHGLKKVKKIVRGGQTRQESVYKGIIEAGDEAGNRCGIIAVHDGARPFIRQEHIMDSIRAACEYGACCVAVPVKDTIKIADADGMVRSTPERSMLWSVQTPQVFKREILINAHEKALRDGFKGTDDAVLVERCGYPLKLVPGSYDNVKITTAEDIALAGVIAEQFIPQ
jgi:2-C-methyl-D-erythritol 4-phosphate cytidylyltransferase